MKAKLRLMAAFIPVLVIIFYACQDDNPVNPDDPDKGDYELIAKYDSIRSYPGGGGIFIVNIAPDKEYAGDVELKIEADERLNAQLTKIKLDNQSTVSNLILKPENSLETGTYEIKVSSTHANKKKVKFLKVNVMDWGENVDDANQKLLQFKSWIDANKPEFSNIFDYQDVYSTYTEILIVEHYTFLNEEYEVRLCYHVMIEPLDWSKLCIRRLNDSVPVLALLRGIDDDISEIPVDEYPILHGY